MSQAAADPVADAVAHYEWRLRYHVGDLEHYTAWSTDFATVESLFVQYRRGDYAHDVALEQRERDQP